MFVLVFVPNSTSKSTIEFVCDLDWNQRKICKPLDEVAKDMVLETANHRMNNNKSTNGRWWVSRLTIPPNRLKGWCECKFIHNGKWEQKINDRKQNHIFQFKPNLRAVVLAFNSPDIEYVEHIKNETRAYWVSTDTIYCLDKSVTAIVINGKRIHTTTPQPTTTYSPYIPHKRGTKYHTIHLKIPIQHLRDALRQEPKIEVNGILYNIQLQGVVDDIYASVLSTTTLGIKNNTFTLWEPLAQSVSIIYTSQNDLTEWCCVMKLSQTTGCWSIAEDTLKVPKVYKYRFLLIYPNQTMYEVKDPYGYAVSPCRYFSLRVNNTLIEQTRAPMHSKPNNVIAEAHILDLSENGFMGIVKDDHVMSHLRNLSNSGLDCIQLLPVFEIASIATNAAPLRCLTKQTTKSKHLHSRYLDNYNWGYDPGCYGALHPGYGDPDRIIEEFTTLIDCLHKLGLRVILDVVFNHAFPTSDLQYIANGYYFRKSRLGRILNSGVGLDTATENVMVRHLFREAVVLRFRRMYGIDGYRLDLANLLTKQTVDEYAQLDRMILSGECWDFGSLIDRTNEWKADTLDVPTKFEPPNIHKIANFLPFDDIYRDSILGSIFSKDMGGLFGNNPSILETILTKPSNSKLRYLTCHDNHTLHDLLQYKSCDPKRLHRTQQLVLVLLLLTPGSVLYSLGDEFMRTKSGDSNSYASGRDINAINWSYVSNTKEIFYRMLWIRKQYDLSNSTNIEIGYMLRTDRCIVTMNLTNKWLRLNLPTEIRIQKKVWLFPDDKSNHPNNMISQQPNTISIWSIDA